MENNLNAFDPAFTPKEAKQIKDLFWKDKEFRTNYFTIRNAWLLQKISVNDAVNRMKDALKEAVKRNNL
jgi:hypothetical protein